MAAKHGGADYERALIEFIVPRLQPGDVFVDVGAHVGYVSAFAAPTGAAVFAIEIQRELIPLLEQLAALDQFDLLRAPQAGASRPTGMSLIACGELTRGGPSANNPYRYITDEPDSTADASSPSLTTQTALRAAQ